MPGRQKRQTPLAGGAVAKQSTLETQQIIDVESQGDKAANRNGSTTTKDPRASAKTCAGCSKPFGPARKLRSLGTVGFLGSDGQISAMPVPLCGRCTAIVASPGARPFDLPGLEKLAQELEVLTLAERTGALQ